METRRFYTSPVNHHNLERWEDLASSIERAVREASDEISTEVGAVPVFDYDVDARTALQALTRFPVPARHVRVDLWSAIIFYETVCITFGPRITPAETKRIVERLERNELAEQAFLREVEGLYDIDAAQVFGYSFPGAEEDDDVNAMEQLLVPFDTPIYIGPRRSILDENERVDEDAFELFSEEQDVVVFITRDDDAAKRLWKGASEDGLIALFAGDPADGELIDRFPDLQDLRILLAEHPSAAMRVTRGRCHADDHLVVVYTPPDEPEIDAKLVFVI